MSKDEFGGDEDFQGIRSFTLATYRYLSTVRSLRVEHAREVFLAYCISQVIASLGRDTERVERVVLAGVDWFPAALKAAQDLNLSEPGLSSVVWDSGVIGWSYQMWNEHARRSATWAISYRGEDRHERAEVGLLTQLFTDSYIADFLVERCLANRSLPPPSEERSRRFSICDPACGAGHLLVRAIRTLIRDGERREALPFDLHGYDIDPLVIDLCRVSVLVEVVRCGYMGDIGTLWRRFTETIRSLSTPFGTLDRHQVPSGTSFDVVITNPPYLGRRKLSNSLRDYIDRHYPSGRVDLCAAFIQRCSELTASHGALGIVTTDKILRLRGYRALRDGSGDSPGLCKDYTLDSICDLGPRAFHPAFSLHDGLRVCVLCARKEIPLLDHEVPYVNMGDILSYGEKRIAVNMFKRAIQDGSARRISQRLLIGDEAHRAYLGVEDLPASLIQSPIRFHERGDVVVGLQTNDDRCFVRYVWEVPPDPSRWRVHCKGGGYARWYGLNRWVLDWERGAHIFFRSEMARAHAEESIERQGWCYSWFANGSLGVRVKEPGWSFGRAAASAIFCEDERLMAFLNSRWASRLVRSIGGKIQLPEGIVKQLPIPVDLSAINPTLIQAVVSVRRRLAACDPTDVLYEPECKREPLSMILLQFLLLSLEGAIEKQVEEALGLAPQDSDLFNQRHGIPVAWFSTRLPDAVPELWGRLPEEYRCLEDVVSRALSSHRRVHNRSVPLCLESLRAAITSRHSHDRKRWLLPPTCLLEDLCRAFLISPIDICHTIVRSADSGVAEALKSKYLPYSVLEHALVMLGHRWWSRRYSGTRVAVEPIPVGDAIKTILEREDLVDIKPEDGREWFRKRFMPWQDSIFLRRSPIRLIEASRDSLVLMHMWDEKCSDITRVVNAECA